MAFRFTSKTRAQVCKAADGLPDLGTWLLRIQNIGDPNLTDAVEGIWCGRSGRVTADLPGTASMLCVGWHNGRVEFSYLS